MIKSTFFLHTNRRAHLFYIFIYTLVVSFFLESGEHMPISFPKVFCIVSSYAVYAECSGSGTAYTA